jgi:hypothetical protein
VRQEIAEIERRTLRQSPEAAADVHQQGVGELVELVTDREAAHPQLRDHQPELRAELLQRQLLGAREGCPLSDVSVDPDAKAEVERDSRGPRSLGPGAGGLDVGHGSFLSARPKVACEDPHAGARKESRPGLRPGVPSRSRGLDA